jgi:dihydroxyacetone kinase
MLQVLAEATAAAERVGTMGVALTVCSLPGQPPSTRLDSSSIEIGLGMHACTHCDCNSLTQQPKIVSIYLHHNFSMCALLGFLTTEYIKA